ncbi:MULTISPECIES: glycosyltransferase [unclassified Rathayibacter]|uniref:glycosyltransferase n=1 Tax=unclassified Rathayibacter TaxID=2609250 RepID=UPI0006F9A730|nr:MULTISPECIES: glycosyltransferase [unclassified Rathayibacter]KQP97443.1 hypothetical protein ASF42_17255 [Rathayibacter sp. Leaf294]KQS07115.1 hypothetical protein ASG06_17990 [Rathayibacter sp. Leaf185]
MKSTIRTMSDIPYHYLVDAEKVGRATSARTLVVTTARFCIGSHRNDVLITSQGARTVLGLILLSAYLFVTRQKKLVLVEFLPGRRGAVVAFLYRMLLPRVVRGAQTMTEWEREHLANQYGFAQEQLVHIPFYYSDDRDGVAGPVGPDQRRGVMSSGRNSCDWKTLIAAADGQDWDLRIFCNDDEAASLAAEAQRAGVTISGRVPRAEHDSVMAHSTLFILALIDSDKSAGHVRLMSAATFGTPVVATDAVGIRGYEDLAVAVTPVADHIALREAVNSLLADAPELAERNEKVSSIARRRPYSRYEDDLRAFFLASASGG